MPSALFAPGAMMPLLCSAVAAATPGSSSILPAPQHLTLRSHHVVSVDKWPVGFGVASAPPGVKLAAEMLFSRLTGSTRAAPSIPTAKLPKKSFIALGIPTLDPDLDNLAVERNLSVSLNSDLLGEEGYLLDINQDGVVLVAPYERGVFYGVQTLLNLSQPFAAGEAMSWPALSIMDFPSKPLRGADVENSPKFTDGGMQWMFQFLDRLASRKLNYCSFDASSSYWNGWSDCETSLESHGQDACGNLTKIVKYARERFIDLVPNIVTIGSNGGIAQTIANTADGYWVRNLSFTFDDNETASADLPGNAGPPNGAFTQMNHGGKMPKGWLINGSRSVDEWAVVPPSICPKKGKPMTCNTQWCRNNRTDTTCGSFLRANVIEPPCPSDAPDPVTGKVCTKRSTILQSEPFVVKAPTVLRLRFWTRVDYLGPNCTTHNPGGVGPTVTAMLTSVSPAGQNYTVGRIDIQPFDRIIREHENAIGDRKFPLHTWEEQTATFVTNQYVKPPPVCVPIPPDGRCAPTKPAEATVVISSSVGGTCNASWSLGAIAIERLDSTLKNVVRTSATDIEVRPVLDDGKPGPLMEEGRDYEVVNASRNLASALSFDSLEPYQVRRIHGGRLLKHGKVALSFDFLPGITATGSKPDVATSLAEPLWYSIAEEAIVNVTKRFGPLRFLGLGFDEVRGAFRDSRTARSGKTNAELMAYAINELARVVHKHSPNTTAVFWADMINPYHNGQSGLDGNTYNLDCAYQARWGGRLGCTGLVLGQHMLNPAHKIMLLPWAYGDDSGCTDPDTNWRCGSHQIIDHSAGLFRNNSVQWAAVPWKTEANFEMWAAAIHDGGDLGMGIVGSDWSYNESPMQWGDIPDISQCAWNPESCINRSRAAKIAPQTRLQTSHRGSEPSAAVKHTASASITNRVLVFPKGLLGFHTFKPPSLLQIPGTDALFAFANGRKSSLDATADNIIMRKSTDAGDTWSEAKIIMKVAKNVTCVPFAHPQGGPIETRDVNDGAPVWDNHTSTIVFPYVQSAICGVGNGDSKMIFFSSDMGVSWSAPVNITKSLPNIYAIGPGKGVQIPSGKYAGRLVFCGYGGPYPSLSKNVSENAVICAVSDTHGKSWRQGSPLRATAGFAYHENGRVYHLPTGQPLGQEPQPVVLKNGSILIEARGGLGGSPIFGRSDHGGESWATVWANSWEASGFMIDDCQGNMLSLGEDRLLFSGPWFAGPSCQKSATHHCPPTRVNLTVSHSANGGRDWNVLLSQGLESGGAGYSCMADLTSGTARNGAGSVGLLYVKDESGGPAWSNGSKGFGTDFVRIRLV